MTGRPITSVADVEAIFRDIAAVFTRHGKRNPGDLPDILRIDPWKFKSVSLSSVGRYDCIEGADLIAYHRPDRREGFGWMRRIDIRRGSPTALLTLLYHLKAKGLT